MMKSKEQADIRQAAYQEERLKEAIAEMAAEIRMSDDRQRRMLEDIHGQIQERSKIVRKITGKKVVLAAAVMAVLVGGTAIGAGKIVSLSSHHFVDQVDFHSAGEAMENTDLGGTAKAVSAFSDGTRFEKGYRIDVEAKDSSGAQVGSYPQINMHYENNLYLDVSKPLGGIENSSYPVILEEEYNGTSIQVSQMEYLFLPPDAQPSEEDRKRQEEGTLEISYGTDKEERKVFLSASWEDGGLTYLLFTMEEGHDGAELMQKAKEIIDVEPQGKAG